MTYQHSTQLNSEGSRSDVSRVLNDWGWHYANVVLYHLYNKYAWLQTREPSLAQLSLRDDTVSTWPSKVQVESYTRT